MIGIAARYRSLLAELLIERQLAGGKLPEEKESSYIEELDRCWWEMTDEEHDAVEADFAVMAAIDAPASLNVQDRVVTKDAHELPREAKAA